MSRFKLKSNFRPTGDQPQAIAKLSNNILSGVKDQVLLGVTGSGKTYTMAQVIEKIQRPVLVISHNKTLAWQLYKEFKEFFPDNSVHYFVSYYDYYQPEAYIPQSDTYIEKDARINQEIDQMRHAATQGLLTRPDTIVVASVSCIYNIGSPEDYSDLSLEISAGQKLARKELLSNLISLGYTRNEADPSYGQFRARGDRIEAYPATGEKKIIIEISQNKILKISEAKLDKLNSPHTTYYILHTTRIFPAHFWTTPDNKQKIAISNIRNELCDYLKLLKKQGKLIEAQRIERRTNFDLELIEETGFCHGIENYSRHLDFRKPGEAPYTLLDYLKLSGSDPDSNGFITFIDESHMTIPQLRGMYFGDRSRKETLINYGFRLPSAIDNRPLTFSEFNKKIGRTIYVSATPAEYELKKSYVRGRTPHIVEQLVRPTGLVDPSCEIRPTKNQMADLIKEIEKRVAKNQRVLVTTITKRLAEDIAEYLVERNIKAYYLHSEIHTLERPKILNDLRLGKYNVVVGINLLREGLDLPEVSLVAILDADKEGFLRNYTTLIQTMGRAARHIEGYVIMYADVMTDSMKRAIKETDRRRETQKNYNLDHNITPRSINKPLVSEGDQPGNTQNFTQNDAEITYFDELAIRELEKEMKKAARQLDFEKAAGLRDKIKKLT